MAPWWWRHRNAACGTAALPHAVAEVTAKPPPARPMEFDLSWLLLGLPLAFILGWLASRFDLRQLRMENRRAPEGLFPGPELPAQRAAGPGHRRLHRSGPERPRHLRAALRAGQPVPPPRRIRAGRAGAPAPAVARRPEHGRPPPCPACTGPGLPARRPARPGRGGACSSSKAHRSRPKPGWPCWPTTNARATGSMRPKSRSDWSSPTRAASPAGWRITCANRPRPIWPPRSRTRPVRLLRAGGPDAPDGPGRAWNWPGCCTSVATPLARWPTCSRKPRGAPAAACRWSPASWPNWHRHRPHRPSVLALLKAHYEKSPCDRPAGGHRDLEEQHLGGHRTGPHLVPAPPGAQPLAGGGGQVDRRREARARAVPPAGAARARPCGQAADRYRCAACGFEAKQHFWQCPGCQAWDSYPARRVEEL
jgi:hypothetical protein